MANRIGTNGTITISCVKYPCTLTDIKIHPPAPESPKSIVQEFCFEIPFKWSKHQKRRFFSAAHPRRMRIHKKARGLVQFCRLTGCRPQEVPTKVQEAVGSSESIAAGTNAIRPA